MAAFCEIATVRQGPKLHPQMLLNINRWVPAVSGAQHYKAEFSSTRQIFKAIFNRNGVVVQSRLYPKSKTVAVTLPNTTESDETAPCWANRHKRWRGGTWQVFYRHVRGKETAVSLCTHPFQLQFCTQNVSCYKMHNVQTILAQQLILHRFTFIRRTNQTVLLMPSLGKEKHYYFVAL